MNGKQVSVIEIAVCPSDRRCVAQGFYCDGSDPEIWKRSDRTATKDWKEVPLRTDSNLCDLVENETNEYGTEIVIWTDAGRSKVIGCALSVNWTVIRVKLSEIALY